MPTVYERRRSPLPPDFNPDLLPSQAKEYMTILREGGTYLAEVGPYVGRLPLLDGTELTLSTKVPVQDIGYLILRAERTDKLFLEEYRQNVGVTSVTSQLDSLYIVYARRFLSAVDEVRRFGALREREVQIHLRGARSGKVHLPSYRKTYARSFGFDIPTITTHQDADAPENRLARFICNYLMGNPITPEHLHELVDDSEVFLEQLGVTDLRDAPDLLDDDIEHCQHVLVTNRTPASRPYYRELLEAGLAILRHSGFSLEGSADTESAPFIVNLENVFERYVREVARDVAARAGRGHAVYSGEDQRLNLYVEGGPPLKPDVLFERGKQFPLVVDAKYKSWPSPDDHYQMLAYAEVYPGVQRSVLVCAPEEAEQRAEYTTRHSHRRVDVFPFDLANILESEQQLGDYLVHLLT